MLIQAIRFQNKRQASRQSRTATSALPPLMNNPYTNAPLHMPHSGGHGAGSASGNAGYGEVSVTSSNVSGCFDTLFIVLFLIDSGLGSYHQTLITLAEALWILMDVPSAEGPTNHRSIEHSRIIHPTNWTPH